ncbi:MAG: nitroreductase family protein [Lacrimispora sphenoides]
MNLDFPVEQMVKQRYSVRTYQQSNPISEADKEKLMTYAKALSNPFGVPVSFHLLETKDSNAKKLGTYGVIKGTKVYIGVTVPAGAYSLEAVGYDFEKLILYATSLGIGTCWLAATFDRSAFTSAIGVKENEQFPAISPIGYASEKKSLTEALFRKTLKSNQRKNWNELFFKDSFSTPLTKQDAGEYASPLDLLRLAPSATNKQPWRVLKTNDAYHFYGQIDPSKTDEHPETIERVDVGIGASHFHLAALEKGLSGRFEKLSDVNIAVPTEVRYLFSWIPERK